MFVLLYADDADALEQTKWFFKLTKICSVNAQNINFDKTKLMTVDTRSRVVNLGATTKLC